MTTVSILKQTYGYEVPILLKDIRIGGKSKTAIRKELSRAVESGEITRKCNGVYCFTRDKSLGDTVTFDRILTKKYVKDDFGINGFNTNVYGYYTGYTFINWLGISAQVPAVPQITTNKTSCYREIKYRNRKAILYKSKATINHENYKALQFFEMFIWLSEDEYNANIDIIFDYYKKNLTIRDLQYSKYFRGKCLDDFCNKCVDYEITRV